MKRIQVVAAIIEKGGKIFATQRGYGDFKDWWEFPGGKIEPFETPRQALAREIREELDADIQVGPLIRSVEYDYPAFHLTMHCFLCRPGSGELHLLEHEAARWLDARDIHSVQWLPADDDILPEVIRIMEKYGPVQDGFMKYDLGEGVTAFSTQRNAVLPFKVVQGHQVHSDAIAEVSSPDTSREELEGYDAFITNVPGVAVGVRTADCIPVLLFDPVHKAVAAVHAGWKGTVLKIAAKTIRRMSERYGTIPEDLKAVIGPGIGPESFQVGQEVADAFTGAGFAAERVLSDRGPREDGSMRGGLHIDLWECNRITLEEAGVKSGNIFVSGIDTYAEDAFFSARREGTACGRIINAVMLAED